MLSVVYPSQMYVANQQQPYYYVQSTPAGQWASVPSSGANYVYTTQPQQQPQRPQITTVAPAGYSLVPPQHQQRVRTTSTYAVQRPITSAVPPQPMRSQSYPPTTVPHHPPPQISRQPLQRKMSSVSLRRGSFDSSDGIAPDADDWIPASPVLSDTTSSSGSSSGSSHLNLSRSAMNHYTAPQRSRRRDSFGAQGPLAFPPSHVQQQPRQIAPPPISNVQYSSSAPHPQPTFARTTGNSARPISFHEEKNPVYSSYELYQPRSHPPTRPSLNRRASSRSLSRGIPDLSPSAYGAPLGMGGPGMGIGGGCGPGDDYDKKKWWKVGR